MLFNMVRLPGKMKLIEFFLLPGLGRSGEGKQSEQRKQSKGCPC